MWRLGQIHFAGQIVNWHGFRVVMRGRELVVAAAFGVRMPNACATGGEREWLRRDEVAESGTGPRQHSPNREKPNIGSLQERQPAPALQIIGENRILGPFRSAIPRQFSH